MALSLEPDPVLRAKLTPDYALGCKRILLMNTYCPALSKPNVSVPTCGIREIRSHAVVTNDGEERPADVIVFGTYRWITRRFDIANYIVRGGSGKG